MPAAAVDHLLGAAVVALAVVLLAAGTGKVARPPAPAQLAALGLPRWAHRPATIRLHAVAEIVVGLALVTVPGPWLVAPALAAAVLTATYLVVSWRAWRSPEPLGCHCFGWDDDRVVGPAHLALNVALVVAAVVAVVAGVRGWWAIDDLPPIVLGIAGAVALVAHLWGLSGNGGDTDRGGRPYLRRPIPKGQVVVDGRAVELTDLARERAQLLVRMPLIGREREYLLAALPEWRRRLPHVDVRVTEGDARGGYRRLGILGAPSAVVLGADGLLAGGPVSGGDRIRELVEELAGIAPTTS
ncbi:MauE/DoxX family redox-associated membrane protein [Georgenia sp. Z1344]|uniref:MauE/DoxX family redox-associated membrane protein n=1 Tax=Georgenia sp. Z1344 TaxID=3416706 RepID=UPI003CF5E9FB